jgi:hypothetical protein
MNWRRGLWRIWLAVTVLWIACSSWAAGPIDRFHRLSDPVRFSVENVEHEFPGDMEPNLIKTAIAEWIKQQRDAKAKNYFDRFDEPPDKIANRIVGNYQPRSVLSILRDWAGLALLPPAVLLALGSLIFWALRGFGRDQA